MGACTDRRAWTPPARRCGWPTPRPPRPWRSRPRRVRRARRRGDATARAVAERAWGQALRHRGDLDRALTHLQRSLRCAEEAGDAPTAAAAAAHRGVPARRARPRAARPRRARPGGRHARRRRGAAPARWPSAAGSCSTWAATARRSTTTAGAARAARRRRRALGLPGDLATAASPTPSGTSSPRRRRTCAWRSGSREEQSLPWRSGFAQANLAFVLGLRGETGGRVRLLRRRRAAHPRAGRPPRASCWSTAADLLLSVRLVGEAREAAEQAVAEFAREPPRHEAAPRPGWSSPRPPCSTATPRPRCRTPGGRRGSSAASTGRSGPRSPGSWCCARRCPDGCARAADVRAAPRGRRGR